MWQCLGLRAASVGRSCEHVIALDGAAVVRYPSVPVSKAQLFKVDEESTAEHVGCSRGSNGWSALEANVYGHLQGIA